MPELEDMGETGGNLSAVQSISAKLLEVTRLAEKLDARLCEAGARTRALDPAGDEAKPELPLSSEKSNDIPQGASANGAVQSIRERDRSIVEDSNVEEYVTATECSSTPVPRSRSESFLSSEYEDALVSTTCRKTENEATKMNEIIPVVKCETVMPTNPNDQELIIEFSPNGASVIQRTIQEKGGKIVKEVTETTTLRVAQDTRMGVASYKLVSNTMSGQNENVDICGLKELNCTPDTNETSSKEALQTNREEHTYASANGYHKNYLKSSAATATADVVDESSRCYKQELLAMGRTVSEDAEKEEKKDPPKPEADPFSPELVGC